MLTNKVKQALDVIMGKISFRLTVKNARQKNKSKISPAKVKRRLINCSGVMLLSTSLEKNQPKDAINVVSNSRMSPL